MAASMAEMLDQLMGQERDVPLEHRTNRVRQFHDDDVCKFYLCGLDLHLFRNTRSADELARHVHERDFARVQDNNLKAVWEELPDDQKVKYGQGHAGDSRIR